MANLGQTYDTSDLPEGGGGFDPVPPGWYNVSITQATLENTKNGSGQYINVRYDIIGPSFQGRVVFGKIHIKNANPKAEEYARADLGNLMRAIGLARVTDTDQLIGANLKIKLNIRPERVDEDTGKTYDATNEVRGFKAMEGAVPNMGGTHKEPSAPTSGKAAPPWAAKK